MFFLLYMSVLHTNKRSRSASVRIIWRIVFKLDLLFSNDKLGLIFKLVKVNFPPSPFSSVSCRTREDLSDTIWQLNGDLQLLSLLLIHAPATNFPAWIRDIDLSATPRTSRTPATIMVVPSTPVLRSIVPNSSPEPLSLVISTVVACTISFFGIILVFSMESVSFTAPRFLIYFLPLISTSLSFTIRTTFSDIIGICSFVFSNSR